MTNEVVVQVPGMSKAMLADLLAGISMRDNRFKVVIREPDSRLNADPATITIATAVLTVAATEIVKAAVNAFMEWLKERRQKPAQPKAHVTIVMALGDRKTFVISRLSEIDLLLQDVPADAASIGSVILREA